jgi:hypothetical protein
MSVANSGIFTIVNAVQVELAEVAEEVTVLNDATQILYNWQFRRGFNINGVPVGTPDVPAGPLPAGIYAATGFVTISDTAFTRLSVQIAGPDETPLSSYYSGTNFVQPTHYIDEYTLPVSFYFKVDQDLPSIMLSIATTNQSLYGNITVSVQLYKVNQAWPTPIAPA